MKCMAFVLWCMCVPPCPHHDRRSMPCRLRRTDRRSTSGTSHWAGPRCMLLPPRTTLRQHSCCSRQGRAPTVCQHTVACPLCTLQSCLGESAGCCGSCIAQQAWPDARVFVQLWYSRVWYCCQYVCHLRSAAMTATGGAWPFLFVSVKF